MEINTGHIQQAANYQIDQPKPQQSGTPQANIPEMLEASLPTAENVALKAVMSQTLANFGFKLTSENMKLIEALMQKGFPVNKENLNLLNQAVKMTGLTAEKAMFFLSNDIKPSSANAELLKNFVGGESKIANLLTEIAKEIDKLPQGDLKNKLLELISEKKPLLPESFPKTETEMKEQIIKIMENPEKAAAEITAKLSSGNNNDQKQGAEILKFLESQPDLKQVVSGAKELSKTIDIKTAEFLQAFKKFNSETAEKPTLQEVGKFMEEALSSDQEFIDVPELKEAVLNKILDEFEKAGNDPKQLKEIAEKLLSPEKDAAANAVKRLFVNIKEANPKIVEKKLNEINEFTKEIAKTIAESGSDAAKVQKSAESIGKQLEFANLIKESVYVQLPFVLNEVKSECDLFVFKDKRNKSKKATTSALIGLDTANLGRVESYILKEDSTVNLQFRLDSDKTKNLLRENISKLEELLKSKNLGLSAVSFFKIDENFNITSKKPDESQIDFSGSSFDVRT